MSFVLEVTVPKSWWDEKAVQREIAKTLKKETGKKIQKDFRSTTKGWKRENKPSFPIQFQKSSNRMSVKVSTKDEPYVFVNDGTAPRIITPKPSRGPNAMLRFKPGYRPATRKGSVNSSRPARSGGFVTVAYVRHPGIQEREFDATISKRQRQPFGLDITAAIYRGMTN